MVNCISVSHIPSAPSPRPRWSYVSSVGWNSPPPSSLLQRAIISIVKPTEITDFHISWNQNVAHNLGIVGYPAGSFSCFSPGECWDRKLKYDITTTILQYVTQRSKKSEETITMKVSMGHGEIAPSACTSEMPYFNSSGRQRSGRSMRWEPKGVKKQNITKGRGLKLL